MTSSTRTASRFPQRPVDAIDRRLLTLLAADGRSSNADLARQIGIPESTCAGRVRALFDRGAIRGVHADVDPELFGRGVEAMVALRFTGHAKLAIDDFRERVAQIPGVISAYHVAGGNDFLVHVGVGSPHELRDFVLDHLTSVPGVAHAETSLIFERIVGRSAVG